MSEWRQVRLGDCVKKIGSGATPRGGQEVYQESGIALIRSQNIYNNYFSLDGLVYINDEQAQKLSNVTVEPGDVLLNITGDSVARVCQVPDWVLPARVNQHVAIIRPDKSILDATFIRYFLVSPQMQAHMLTLAGSGATRKALTKGMIEDFQIPAFPLDEQRAIAHILGSLDDKIEANRRLNETLEATARAIFKSWFVDFDPVHYKARGEHPPGMDAATAALFPDSFEESALGPIPRGWGVGSIGDVANFNIRTLSKKDKLDQIEYVEISEVMRGEIGAIKTFVRGEEPSRARRRLQHGDTALSTVRPDRGAYFLCLNPSPFLIASTGFAVFTPKSGCWSFLHAALIRPETFERLGALADGAAYPAVAPEMIAALPTAIPSSELMSVFHEITASLYEQADLNREESRTLAETRDALLPRLVSGEVRVPHP